MVRLGVIGPGTAWSGQVWCGMEQRVRPVATRIYVDTWVRVATWRPPSAPPGALYRAPIPMARIILHVGSHLLLDPGAEHVAAALVEAAVRARAKIAAERDRGREEDPPPASTVRRKRTP